MLTAQASVSMSWINTVLAAAELTQDPGFGLKAGSLVGPASFNVVSFIFQSSPTLREAIALVQKFQRLISDGGRFQIVGGDLKS